MVAPAERAGAELEYSAPAITSICRSIGTAILGCAIEIADTVRGKARKRKPTIRAMTARTKRIKHFVRIGLRAPPGYRYRQRQGRHPDQRISVQSLHDRDLPSCR